MTQSNRLLIVQRSLVSGNFPELIAAQCLLQTQNHSTASSNCLLFMSMISLKTLHLDLLVGFTLRLKGFHISYIFYSRERSKHTLTYQAGDSSNLNFSN